MAIVNARPTVSTEATAPSSSYPGALAIVTTLFFVWGFLTVLNDILVPHLKSIFDLNYAQVMLIQFAFFSAYFIFSLPSGWLIDWIGYKRSMVVGLLTMALGALLFIPAARVPSYPLFLGALIVLAAGMTVLQVSANPYVSVLGPPRTASSRLNLTQAFNSLGTMIAPYVGAGLILTSAPKGISEIRQMSAATLHAYRLHEASTVKMPYLGFAIVLIVLALFMALMKLPPMATAEHHGFKPAISLWNYRHLILGAVGIFTYVGAEVAIGSFLVNYFTQPYIGNIPERVAAHYVSFYWGGAMVGRFLGSAILQKVRTPIVLGSAAVAAFILVITTILTTGHAAMWAILLVGLFNSIMFPSIFTLGIAELGPQTGDASGVLIMAIVGGAIIPWLQGGLADRIGIHHAFILPAACYLYILFYALKGSKPAIVT